MKPEDAAAVAARNAEEVERAKQADKPGVLGDTATQMDSLDTVLHLASDVGGFLWDGACTMGRGVGAVCEAVDSVIPKLD
ncbi:hypothetical protein SAMN02745194_02820 [Roseomonas rosea]|uniref:Uncharacterized protein n=1 Tax=Muricoccus roseus TaxID=198092 RepID=A0A1M6K4Y3_9PROT|nr:hypothetical protein [Roseomonas rosea]SHJ53988.1 hypothetical protein SAMN02745194_02820 [Roseomonas rosea]